MGLIDLHSFCSASRSFDTCSRQRRSRSSSSLQHNGYSFLVHWGSFSSVMKVSWFVCVVKFCFTHLMLMTLAVIEGAAWCASIQLT